MYLTTYMVTLNTTGLSMGVATCTCTWSPCMLRQIFCKNTSKRIKFSFNIKDFCNCMYVLGLVKTYSGITQQAFGLLNKITQKLMLCKPLQFIWNFYTIGNNKLLELLLLTWSIHTKQLPRHPAVNELLLGLLGIFVVTMHGIGRTTVHVFGKSIACTAILL